MGWKSKRIHLSPPALVLAAVILMALPVSQETRFIADTETGYFVRTYSYFSFFAFGSGSLPPFPTAIFTSLFFVVLVIRRRIHRPLTSGAGVIVLSVVCFLLSSLCLLSYFGWPTVWSWLICILLALNLAAVSVSLWKQRADAKRPPA